MPRDLLEGSAVQEEAAEVARRGAKALPLRPHKTELVCLDSEAGTAEEGGMLLGKAGGLPAEVSDETIPAVKSLNNEHQELSIRNLPP